MNKNLPNRRTIRLKDHDYSADGCYFITICTAERLCSFGHIENGDMVLNECGRIARECIDAITEIHPHVRILAFAVMPDHVHLILHVSIYNSVDSNGANQTHYSSDIPFNAALNESLCHSDHENDTVNAWKAKREEMRNRSKELIPRIVQQYKTAAVKRAKQRNQLGEYIYWHRGYYERIIRNNDELKTVVEYVQSNPANWKYNEHGISDSGIL